MKFLNSLVVLCFLILQVVCDDNSTTTAATTTTSTTEDPMIMDKLWRGIHSHKVMLYSKTYCKFSKRIKKLLSNYEIDDMEILELDKQADMKALQAALMKISGRSTVPQLFVDGEFIGGSDDTKVLDEKGELKPILLRAHALRR